MAAMGPQQSSRAERRAIQEAQRHEKALSQLSERACEIVLVRHGETQWNVEQRLQGQLVPGPGLTGRGRQQAEALAARLASEPFDCIYTSDLLRAVETAEIVLAAQRQCSSNGSSAGQQEQQLGSAAGNGAQAAAAAVGDGPSGSHSCLAGNGAGAAEPTAAAAEAGTPMRQDYRLRERFLGSLQGLTRAEAARRHPAEYEALGVASGSLPGGFPESIERLEARAGAVLQDLAAAHPGQRLLVITHGGFLQAAHKCAAGSHNVFKNMNAALNTIRVEALGPAGSKRQQWRWAVVRWGDVEHLAGVGALASGFGGGSEG